VPGPPPLAPLTFLGELACDGIPVTASTTGTGSTVPTFTGVSPDVAYSFTLSEDSPVELSTCGSKYDTWLHLYTANGEMLGEQLESCDDCGDCASSSLHTVLSSFEGSLDPSLPAGAPNQRSHVKITTKTLEWYE